MRVRLAEAHARPLMLPPAFPAVLPRPPSLPPSVPQSQEHAALRAKRAVVAIVEFSVCTHSVPVGLDLGLQPSNTFMGLFIAIMFHQVRK